MRLIAAFLVVAQTVVVSATPLLADETQTPTGNAIAELLQRDDAATPARSDMRAFYAERGFAAMWVEDSGFTAKAAAVNAELEKAGDWGLDEAGYAVAAPAGSDARALAEAEVRLSTAVLAYAEAARGGRISDPAAQLSSYLDRRPSLAKPIDVLGGMAASTQPDAYLLSFHPQHEQFKKLQAAYQAARAGRSTARAAGLPDGGPSLLAGMDHADVAALRRRLGFGEGSKFDAALTVAVKEFQRANGLKPVDGIVGRKTRRALNASNAPSLATLRANMEQWRWMPADLGGDNITVNIPSFQAVLTKNGVPVLEERVVVGKPEMQTPIFSKDLRTVVLHPRWRVPETIMLREFLPSLMAGRSLESRGFLLRRNGKTVNSARVNWQKADLRAYEVYQESGDDNALGQVKFLFPNKHSVYLHDTPSKGLFEANVRAFSHGCVRLRNPMKLAQVLLQDDKGWDGATVKTLMDEGPFDNAVPLDKRLPVHMTYFTAWADDSGRVRVTPDIYGHEKRITAALEGRWKDIDKGKDHLAPVDMAEIKRLMPARVAARRPAGKVAGAFAPPMGLFGSASWGSPAPSGTSANDIFRRSFGN